MKLTVQIEDDDLYIGSYYLKFQNWRSVKTGHCIIVDFGKLVTIREGMLT